MPISRQRKVSLAALGVMVTALGVDRFILGTGASGPQSASASLAVPQGSFSTDAIVAAKQVNPVQTRSIALRLEDCRDSLPTGSAGPPTLFHDSPAWLVQAPEQAKIEVPETKKDDFSDFATKHKLTSVMLGGQTTMAVIDGVCVKRGEMFAGLRLSKIEQGTAVLEGEGHVVRLTLDPMFQQSKQETTK